MSTSFSDSGNRRWARTTAERAMTLLEAVHRLLVEPLHDAHQQLDGAVEIAAIDDADVAVDVARRHAHRDAGDTLAGDVELAGIGAAALHRLELERDPQLLGG